MAKISEYGNYGTGKSPEQIAEFKGTGVIPVSGSYTGSNNDMETKNVTLSELLTSGGVPTIESGDNNKVLTVKSGEASWETLPASSGIKSISEGIGISVTNGNTVGIDITHGTANQLLAVNSLGNGVEWINKPSADVAVDGGIVNNISNELTLDGISTATAGQIPSKSTNGGLEWINIPAIPSDAGTKNYVLTFVNASPTWVALDSSAANDHLVWATEGS